MYENFYFFKLKSSELYIHMYNAYVSVYILLYDMYVCIQYNINTVNNNI